MAMVNIAWVTEQIDERISELRTIQAEWEEGDNVIAKSEAKIIRRAIRELQQLIERLERRTR